MDESALTLSEHCVMQAVGDKVYVMNLVEGETFILKDESADIFRLALAHKPLDAIASKIAEGRGVSLDEARKDAEDFLRELKNQKILRYLHR